jgi:NADH-quinone oxidoreductase subunit L
VLFVGWEGVGLCSYLLIGFWFKKKSAADAGKKAFVVNRIGDYAFLLGMFALFAMFGTLEVRGVATKVAAHAARGRLRPAVAGDAAALHRRHRQVAQIPLYVWLPTRWKARRRCRPSSTPRRWSPPAST